MQVCQTGNTTFVWLFTFVSALSNLLGNTVIPVLFKFIYFHNNVFIVFLTSWFLSCICLYNLWIVFTLMCTPTILSPSCILVYLTIHTLARGLLISKIYLFYLQASESMPNVELHLRVSERVMWVFYRVTCCWSRLWSECLMPLLSVFVIRSARSAVSKPGSLASLHCKIKV